ncbi:GTPase activator activity protein [Homalodisca vitripennis]|nr:GTPase activator activity protein [Homalodisca vitripennis]
MRCDDGVLWLDLPTPYLRSASANNQLMKVFKLQKQAKRIIARLNFRESCRNLQKIAAVDSAKSLYFETTLFCISKCFMTTGQDVHSYESRGRGNYRTGRHRTVVCKYLLPNQEIDFIDVGKRQPLLARAEDSSADPSPKKHKTGNNSSTNRSKRSRLEERLSNAELRYIDSGSPDQVQTRVDVHGEDSRSPSLAEATVSENESLTLSGLTTPDTPTPRPHYTPLTEDSLSEVTTPEYRKLTPSPSHGYENLPRDRLSFPNERIRPRYENVARDRLSFQGVLKNGDLGLCEKQYTQANNEIQYENLNGENFTRIDCNMATEIMDAVMSDSKMKEEEEVKYEEIKESSIYESVDNEKKEMNFYENVSTPLEDDSEIYEPVMRKDLNLSYEEISAQECLISERLQCGGISSSGSLISPVEVNKENEYECLVIDSSPEDSKHPDSNHNLPHSLPPTTANPEENFYEDVQVSWV